MGFLARRAAASAALAMSMAAVPLTSVLSTSTAAPPALSFEIVTGHLHNPLYVTSPRADSRRLFVVEQTGHVMLIKDGALLPTPFLDLTGVVKFGGEQGLLCIAFHPEYSTNGQFFVSYSRDPDNAVVVERYVVSSDPDLADPTSGTEMLEIPLAQDFHNGGMLAFGPLDGLLYVSTGDGGSDADLTNPAQDKSSRCGKLLRIDVDHTSPGLPYAIPFDNPFAGATPGADEIWAMGFRNPWRFSFDRQTGALYLGDVGQGLREEIDYQAPGAAGGANFGWPCIEGNVCAGLGGPCDCLSPSFKKPIHLYDHTQGCAVIGGYVYRGSAIPALKGTYLFGDACDRIWSFKYNGSTVSELVDRTTQLDPGPNAFNLASLGEDAAGELYVVYESGHVVRIVADDSTAPASVLGGGGGGGCR